MEKAEVTPLPKRSGRRRRRVAPNYSKFFAVVYSRAMHLSQQIEHHRVKIQPYVQTESCVYEGEGLAHLSKWWIDVVASYPGRCF